jgi:Icc protein
MPVFVIPGNHDMREAFGREGYLPRAGFLHYAIEEYPLRIVALDTHIPGEHGGPLCAERLLGSIRRWRPRPSGRPSS